MGAGGVVRDPRARADAVREVAAAALELGLGCRDVSEGSQRCNLPPTAEAPGLGEHRMSRGIAPRSRVRPAVSVYVAHLTGCVPLGWCLQAFCLIGTTKQPCPVTMRNWVSPVRRRDPEISRASFGAGTCQNNIERPFVGPALSRLAIVTTRRV